MPPFVQRLDRFASAEGLLVALSAGVAGVAGSFAVAGFTPAFVAGPIAGFLARWLPAPVITFAIVVLGDLGEQLAVLTAVGLAVGLLAATSLVGWAAGRRVGTAAAGSAVAVGLGAAMAMAVTGAPLPSLVAGLGAGAVLAVAGLAGTMRTPSDPSPARRQVLAGGAGALAFVVGGYTLGRRDGETAADPIPGGFDLDASTRADIEASLAEAAETSLAVDGLEPLVSDEFYEVDINPTNPTVDAAEWSLRVTGAVEREVRYGYDDILGMAPESRFVTLRCVGERLNGRKMDNALWTGVPIEPLIEPAGVSPTCCVMLRAADGYYEQFPLPALADGFLAYGMNGDVLPRAHGYPARALIPGHWGEINVKWLTEIEIIDEPIEGYWEERGWHGTGPVNTVAKLHVQRALSDGRVELAGHAYAGTRGIQRVEVSTDNAVTWNEATLSDPLPGDDVWRQWVYRYDPPEDIHEAIVRATDGTGEIQSPEQASAFPNGPSGWVTQSVRP